ncbi:MAG: hypothetical protein ACYSU4_14455 [Planctomycetota bacterium]|jgi:cytochrome b
MMSPENQGVYQLLEEVNFRRIQAFYNSRKWGHFLELLHWLVAPLVGWRGLIGSDFTGTKHKVFGLTK